MEAFLAPTIALQTSADLEEEEEEIDLDANINDDDEEEGDDESEQGDYRSIDGSQLVSEQQIALLNRQSMSTSALNYRDGVGNSPVKGLTNGELKAVSLGLTNAELGNQILLQPWQETTPCKSFQ